MSTKKKKNLSTKTINAIRRMIDGVMAEPQFLNQNQFPRAADCGTTCCGAGQAVFQDLGLRAYKALVRSVHDPENSIDWSSLALKALGLPKDTMTSPLFGRHWEWPEKFSDMYRNAKDPKDRAKAFKARWEHFIEQDGEGLLPVQD